MMLLFLIIRDNIPKIGSSMRSGDFNGDGYDDIIFSYRYSGKMGSDYYALYGSSTGLISSLEGIVEPIVFYEIWYDLL